LALAEKDAARNAGERNANAPARSQTLLIASLLFEGGVYTKAGEELSPAKLCYTRRRRETEKSKQAGVESV
jgi:hypothetical protein